MPDQPGRLSFQGPVVHVPLACSAVVGRFVIALWLCALFASSFANICSVRLHLHQADRTTQSAERTTYKATRTYCRLWTEYGGDAHEHPRFGSSPCMTRPAVNWFQSNPPFSPPPRVYVPFLSSPLLPSLTGLTGLTGLDKPRSDARSPAGTHHMPFTRSLTPDSYTAAWMA